MKMEVRGFHIAGWPQNTIIRDTGFGGKGDWAWGLSREYVRKQGCTHAAHVPRSPDMVG